MGAQDSLLALLPRALLLAAILVGLGLTVPLIIVRLIGPGRRVASVWGPLSEVRSKAAATALRGPEPMLPLHAPVPDALEAATVRLEGLGFIRGEIGLVGGSCPWQMLFRPVDSTVAEAVFLPQGKGHPILIELTSVLQGRRGLLCTTNLPTSVRAWRGELLQAFLGATPEDLVRHHEQSLEYLRGRGIAIDAFGQDEVTEMRAWGIRMSRRPLAELPMREVARLHSREGYAEWLWVGLIENNPRIEDKLEYLRRDEASLPSTPSP